MNFPTGPLIAAWLILAGGGQTQETQKQAALERSAKKSDAKGTTAPAPQVSVNDVEYRIGPQDVLRIDVWKEPEVSRAVPVRPDGKISLPLLNDVQAAGLTPMQLSEVIGDGLKKYMNNPQVTVTVSEALSSSGGFTQFAKVKSIYVLRTVDGQEAKLPFNYKDVVSGKKNEQNILLQPGDVIVVP